jgi:hypothetical protein
VKFEDFAGKLPPPERQRESSAWSSFDFVGAARLPNLGARIACVLHHIKQYSQICLEINNFRIMRALAFGRDQPLRDTWAGRHHGNEAAAGCP